MLLLYPRGHMQKEFVFLFLERVDWEFGTPAPRLYMEYKLRIRDQNANDHIESRGQNWYSALDKNCGFPKFLLLNSLNDPAKSYKVKDNVIVEAEIKVMGLVKNFC